MPKDYYSILGVDRSVSPDDLKKAYRKLAVEHHPDKGGDEERFKQINEAYSVLSDGQKRQEYDNPHMRGPFDDVFSHIFRPGGGPGFHFGFGGPRRAHMDIPTRGEDLRYVIDTPLNKFIFGGEVSFKINYDEPCQFCNGRGSTNFDTCDKCNGNGSIVEVKSAGGIYVKNVTTCMKCGGAGRMPLGKCEKCDGSGRHFVKDREIVVPIEKNLQEPYVAKSVGQGKKGTLVGPPGDLHIKLRLVVPKEEELTEEQRRILKEL